MQLLFVHTDQLQLHVNENEKRKKKENAKQNGEWNHKAIQIEYIEYLIIGFLCALQSNWPMLYDCFVCSDRFFL